MLKMTEFGGMDVETNLTRDSLMAAQGIALVYSVASRDSFTALEGIWKKIKENKQTRLPAILVRFFIPLFFAVC